MFWMFYVANQLICVSYDIILRPSMQTQCRDIMFIFLSGISSGNPAGDGWEEMEFSEGDVKQASVYKNELWIVLNNGELFMHKN